MFIKKFFLIFILVVSILAVFNTTCVLANPMSPGNFDDIDSQTDAFVSQTGFNKSGVAGQKLSSIVALVIKVFLSLLGIIFVALLVLEGYKWMMARGDEEKVREAKDGITRAIIGLVIVISAYAITYFVFSNLPAGGSTGL